MPMRVRNIAPPEREPTWLRPVDCGGLGGGGGGSPQETHFHRDWEAEDTFMGPTGSYRHLAAARRGLSREVIDAIPQPEGG